MRSWVVVGLWCVLLGQVARAHADDGFDDVKRRARAHFKQGLAHYKVGSYALAVSEYQAAYDLLPNADLLFNLGQAYRMKGDKKAALDAYQRFLAETLEGQAADEAREHVAMLTKELGPQAPRPAPAPPPPSPPPSRVDPPEPTRPATAPVFAEPAPAWPAPSWQVAPRPAPRRAELSLPAPPDNRPLVQKPWFWATIVSGAVVVVVAVGLGVGLGVHGPSPSYGVVTVQ